MLGKSSQRPQIDQHARLAFQLRLFLLIFHQLSKSGFFSCLGYYYSCISSPSPDSIVFSGWFRGKSTSWGPVQPVLKSNCRSAAFPHLPISTSDHSLGLFHANPIGLGYVQDTSVHSSRASNGKFSPGDGQICGQHGNAQFVFADGKGPTGTSLLEGTYVTKSSATISGRKIHSTEKLISARSKLRHWKTRQGQVL